jgi:hypothetical protein
LAKRITFSFKKYPFSRVSITLPFKSSVGAGILVIPFALIPGIIINTRIYSKIMKYWSRKSRRPNAFFVQWDEKQENVLEA